MKNKIIGTIIVFIFLFNLGASLAAESAEADVSVKSTMEYRLLYALGIITDEMKAYDSALEIVTREEAAVYLARLYNMAIDMDASADYVDVEAHRLSSAYIDFAQKMGMFENMDRRRFRPNDPISSEDVSIMASRILGFDKMYGISKDYPMEYYSQGQKSGFFRGVSNGSPFTRKDFLKGLVNILNADICQQVSYGQNTKFITEPGNTLLKTRFHTIKASGTVTGYGFINLYGNTEIGLGKIAVNGEPYSVVISDDIDLTAYVGHIVTYYLNTADDDRKHIVFMEKDKKSLEITFSGEDVAKESNSATIVYSSTTGRTETLALSRNHKVFFNGNNMGMLTEDLLETMQNKEASIKLIDSNDDSQYDVIFIYLYETYVVDAVNVDAKRIYVKYDKFIEKNRYISLNADEGYQAELFANGVPTSIDKLRADNVLSCIPTYNNGSLVNLKILVSRRTVTGVVEETAEDWFVINANRYLLSSHYQQIVGLYPDAPRIKLGSEGRFFLDAAGNIAAVKLNKDVYYGYMQKLYKKTPSSLNDEYGIEIYDETGVWFAGDLAGTVILDGKKVKRSACAAALTQAGSFVPQVIRFSISNDKVVMIDTVQVGNGDPDNDVLALKDIYHASMGTDYGNITGRYYRFINQSWFMILPENKDKKDNYAMISRHGFSEGQTVYLQVYGIDEFNTVTFSVFDYSDLAGVEIYENYVMVVDRAADVINSEDEVVKRLYGYYARGGWGSGEMRDAVLDEAEAGVFDKVKHGDVLMFKLDSSGKATRAKSVFTLEDAKTSAPFHRNNTLKDETSFGTILKVDSTRMLMLMDIGGTTQVFWFGAVSAYDMNTGKILKIDPKDLTPGKKVFNWGYWNLPFLTIMYIE